MIWWIVFCLQIAATLQCELSYKSKGLPLLGGCALTSIYLTIIVNDRSWFRCIHTRLEAGSCIFVFFQLFFLFFCQFMIRFFLSDWFWLFWNVNLLIDFTIFIKFKSESFMFFQSTLTERFGTKRILHCQEFLLDGSSNQRLNFLRVDITSMFDKHSVANHYHVIIWLSNPWDVGI